jgi:predicted enzyme related to lactoylglutathione lyase
MKIKLSSVMVEDQDKALKFYTQVLGFVKKNDIPMGEARWLTVASPQAPTNPAAKTYQEAIFKQGIPLTAFAVDDIHGEYTRMKKLGVEFRSEPHSVGPATIALFDDTCGICPWRNSMLYGEFKILVQA